MSCAPCKDQDLQPYSAHGRLAPGQSVTGTQIQTHSVPVAFARGMLIDGSDVLYGVQGSPSYLYKFPLEADGPADVTVGYTFENGTRFDGLQLIGDPGRRWPGLQAKAAPVSRRRAGRDRSHRIA
jgi:hypothetical protein